MARKGRKDRGLFSRANATGKVVWFVRLSHQGKDRQFGSFEHKTAAREFYEKAKLEQQEGRFFPERFQRVTAEPIQDILDDYLLTATGKTCH